MWVRGGRGTTTTTRRADQSRSSPGVPAVHTFASTSNVAALETPRHFCPYDMKAAVAHCSPARRPLGWTRGGQGGEWGDGAACVICRLPA